MSLDPTNLKNYDLLLSSAKIKKGVKKLARAINRGYKNKDVVAVTVLDGAVFFTVDLVRHLKTKSLQMEFVGVASYKSAKQSEKPVITKYLRREIRDKHVLLIEDVLDSGATLDFLQQELLKGSPKSLKTVVLLSKVSDVRKVDVKVDYSAFEGIKGWVIGYGFDVDGYFREKPDILVKKDTR